ncbi:hypothetical protein KUM42_13570 [Modestobacter sp. L9-4]|uniref:hypothetical protein n=1 Tax=Modestobacter sp. L9-4 TaxID=2851567 RepID=UPI001C7454C6|nr:hypothetical protein [Modestobacter sp. L9-4]QXG74882.1 hypothetical protein KUM42_13570 [Modestobacter sp. L9-4]
MLVFIGTGVIAALVFAWGWIGPEPLASFAELLNPTLPLALGSALMLLLMTCRISGDPTGYVEVVGLLLIRRVPVGAIVVVTTAAGLGLRLDSGRTIGSIAYGQSLIGDLIGYPRSKRTALAVMDFVESTRTPDRQSAEVVTVLRGRAIAAVLAAGVLLIGVTVLINHL